MTSRPGLRDLVKRLSTRWLQDVVGERLMYNFGLGADAVLEKLNQGIRARIPTYGDTSANPYLGDDRGIPSGLNEPGASYAQRLKFALDDWQRAGSARALMRQVLGYLYAPRALIRVVSQKSGWDTYLETDDITRAPTHSRALTANWNWDSATTAPIPAIPVANAWIRIWEILYATGSGQATPVTITGATNTTPIVITTATPHGLITGGACVINGVAGNTAANGNHAVTVIDSLNFSLNYTSGNGSPFLLVARVVPAIMAPAPVWGAPGLTWGAPDVSWGLSVPSSEIAAIRAISSQWKGAHAWLLWLIVSFDVTLFDPTKPAGDASLPDGTWGHWSTTVGGVRVPARNANARYCDGVI